MAQKVQVLLLDDIDGGEADETVSFSLDGVTYEIDLSGTNAKTLRDSLTPYVEHARKAGTARRHRSRGASSRERSAEIRTWTKSRGKKVNERGRIPQSIVDEFEAAMGG
jgi:hypothetical protein